MVTTISPTSGFDNSVRIIRNRHVAVHEKRDAAEHALLDQRLHSRQQVPNAADELFDLQLCRWSSHACCRAAVYGVGSKITRFRVIRPSVTLKHSHTKPELTGSE
jgi:hypothetical protein